MKLLRIFLVFCVFGIGGLAWMGFEYRQFVHRPAGTRDAPSDFEIAAHESFNAIARRLTDAGLIGHFNYFKLLARFRGDDKRLKAGQYRLSQTMTPLEVLDTLVDGRVVLHRLTVPEGYTYQDIALEIRRSGLWDADAFLGLARDADLAAEYHIPASTLEGYLFPDTYFFPKQAPARTIVNQMVLRFNEQFSTQWRERAQQLNLSVHQVVTLASIIEKETGAAEERAVIASVFHNRLKKKMRLQSDPTVIYGLEDFDGNITRAHLSATTDYNTYVIQGLPPGPIANPGRLAIEAALFPDETDFLFFVSKKDGTHFFSSTIAEHNQAIRKYQLDRRKHN